MDVIETRGYGPATEHYQRRRNYQRRNHVPWAYADSYFLYRGERQGVRHLTDNLVITSKSSRPRRGRFVAELLTLPPNGYFDRLDFKVRTPEGTNVEVNLLDSKGQYPCQKSVHRCGVARQPISAYRVPLDFPIRPGNARVRRLSVVFQ